MRYFSLGKWRLKRPEPSSALTNSLLFFTLIAVLSVILFSSQRLQGKKSLYSIASENSQAPLVLKNVLSINYTQQDFTACEHVNKIKHRKDKCQFVMEHCESEQVGYFNYLKSYYCSGTSGESSSTAFGRLIYLVWTIVWLITLFMTIGISASDFLCVNLNVLSSILGLSESLAGVTLLALGNGSPDLFSTYASMKIGSGSLAIGELFGAASFIIAIVTGSMAIVRPFSVSRKSFLRDIIFFTLAASFSLYILSDGKLKIWECIVMLILYFSYVLYVVWWYWMQTRRRQKLLTEARARDLYTEPGFEQVIEANDELLLMNPLLERGVDLDGLKNLTIDEENYNFPLLNQEETEASQAEGYEELTSIMHLRRPGETTTGNRSRFNSLSDINSPLSGSHKSTIRPSLFSALEFRSVLANLSSESSVLPPSTSSIPLYGNSRNSTRVDNSSGYLSVNEGLLRSVSHENVPYRTRLNSPSHEVNLDRPHSTVYLYHEDSESETSNPQQSPVVIPPSSLNELITPLPIKSFDKNLIFNDKKLDNITAKENTRVLPTLKIDTITPPSESTSQGTDIFSNTLQYDEYLSPANAYRVRSMSPNMGEPPNLIPIRSPSPCRSEVLPNRRFNTIWNRMIPKFEKSNKFQEFACTLIPTLSGFWSKVWYQKILSILASPAVLLLTISVPVVITNSLDNDDLNQVCLVDSDDEAFGTFTDETTYSNPVVAKSKPWSKEILLIQAVVAPLLVTFFTYFDDLHLCRFLFISLFFSLVFFYYVYNYIPPGFDPSKYRYLSVLGFLISIAWISTIANEVVGILKFFGIIFGVSDAILGLTIFAIGNSLGDLVANVTVASMGFPMMALSACFGGPLLNILVGIGVSALTVLMKDGGKTPFTDGGVYTIDFSPTLLISGMTLLGSLLILFVFVPINNWKMTREIGISTILLWAIATTGNVIFE
ncbi:hypothetical protein NADFUDRAFT_82824, partial [Nadsonia fulvescens var. elongata DSM 6958]